MKKITDQSVFIISMSVAVAIILYGSLLSENLADISEKVMAWVSTNFGWLYIIFVFFLCIFLAWLAFSKYGKIKLGKDNDTVISIGIQCFFAAERE